MVADTASARIEAPAPMVFDFMADPAQLDLWSFGTWRVTLHEDGLIQGRSLQAGSQIWLRIAADRTHLLIDYHIGASPDELSPRIFVRVIPGDVTGHGSERCTLLMTALRASDMDDARWDKMIRAHAVEADLIKSLIETGYDHRRI